MPQYPNYKLIDLFAGAGGLTLGFTDPRFGGGFECIFGLDNAVDAVKTHNLNLGAHSLCANIEQWLENKPRIPSADIVIGGPPCQGFSLLNKNRHGDSRRALWEPFMDVVKQSGARIFVIENVPGLLTSPEFNDLQTRAEQLGFKTASALLNAADYGTPQIRKRAMILGWRAFYDAADGIFPPPPTHASPDSRRAHGKELPDWRTVRDAIGDLPKPVGTEIRACPPPLNLHFGRSPTAVSMARYKAVPPGGNRFDLQRNRLDLTPRCWIKKTSGSTDLFGRLWWDKPSVTIRTEFFKPEKGRYLHPEQDRPITHREAARLMGFPDDFVFVGSKISIAKQIGNAVPPHLGGAVANIVYRLLTVTQTEDRAA